MIELLNIDCMEYMATQPDNAFDLAIVDPPYGIGNKLLNNNNSRKKLGLPCRYHFFDNSNAPEEDYFLELIRISKNQIIWGANHFCDRFNAASSCWIIWDKNNTGDFADCELAYTSFKCAARKFTFRWNGMLQQDMKNKEDRIHPTQKPVALYRWLLEKFSEPGQSVIDTHLGSGSSAIAAHYFGCNFIGCEIDKEFYQAAKKRFQQETKQMVLL